MKQQLIVFALFFAALATVPATHGVDIDILFLDKDQKNIFAKIERGSAEFFGGQAYSKKPDFQEIKQILESQIENKAISNSITQASIVKEDEKGYVVVALSTLTAAALNDFIYNNDLKILAISQLTDTAPKRFRSLLGATNVNDCLAKLKKAISLEENQLVKKVQTPPATTKVQAEEKKQPEPEQQKKVQEKKVQTPPQQSPQPPAQPHKFIRFFKQPGFIPEQQAPTLPYVEIKQTGAQQPEQQQAPRMKITAEQITIPQILGPWANAEVALTDFTDRITTGFSGWFDDKTKQNQADKALKSKDPNTLHKLLLKEAQRENSDLSFLFIDQTTIFYNNNPDSYWGIGAEKNGKNMLGVILMVIKQELENGVEIEDFEVWYNERVKPKEKLEQKIVFNEPEQRSEETQEHVEIPLTPGQKQTLLQMYLLAPLNTFILSPVNNWVLQPTYTYILAPTGRTMNTVWLWLMANLGLRQQIKVN